MDLRELTDLLRRTILRDTSDAVNGDSDKLWLESDLITFINIAHRRMIRKGHLLRSRYTITLVSGQVEYVLPTEVYAVISARFKGNGTTIAQDTFDLARGGHSQFRQFIPPDTIWFDPNPVDNYNAAKPMGFATDEVSAGPIVLSLYPAADSRFTGCTIELRCLRDALVVFDGTNMAAVPEIEEQYQFPMLDYAAYLALRIVDHEAGDPQRAADFLASFNGHIDEANVDMKRKNFSQPQWGFGRGGFSWVGN